MASFAAGPYKLLPLVVALAAAVGVAGCKKDEPLPGTGTAIASKSYPVGGFNEVVATGNAEVVLLTGPFAAVQVSALDDSNDVHDFEFKIKDSVLTISTVSGANFGNNRVVVVVRAPAYNAITQKGSGILTTDTFPSTRATLLLDHKGSGVMKVHSLARNVTADITGSGVFRLTLPDTMQLLTVDHTGSSNVVVDGVMGDSLALRKAGSGNFTSHAMPFHGVNIDHSGGSNSTLRALQTLRGTLSGSGMVEYYGHPATVDVEVNGSGQLIEK